MATARTAKNADVVGGVFADLIKNVRVPEALKVTDDIFLEAPSKKQVTDLFKAASEEDAQKIIFGDQYEAAMALFDDAPVQVWNGFMEKYNEHFFGDKSLGK
ncbi:Uncharacterised protein [Mycobacteroides abscessus subsp. abscessus]|nr:Uncharacterised protein [Mycobacteroides abscessus subsp. abscessus]